MLNSELQLMRSEIIRSPHNPYARFYFSAANLNTHPDKHRPVTHPRRMEPRIALQRSSPQPLPFNSSSKRSLIMFLYLPDVCDGGFAIDRLYGFQAAFIISCRSKRNFELFLGTPNINVVSARQGISSLEDVPLPDSIDRLCRSFLFQLIFVLAVGVGEIVWFLL